MFPERQLGPHRDWKEEIQFLDNLFPNGAAYTVGKVNGDHWLLYLTSPDEVYTPTKPAMVRFSDMTIERNA
jgi:S-adenosylmethionine decarboxylase